MDGSQPTSKIDFRVGRATPLGKALRQYWTPACFSDELPEPDCDPLRIRLLGEPLVAFRDSHGTVGILDEHCPHRKASLAFGRNEQGGLRCLWHRWKFNVRGELLETPNTHDCTLKDRIRAKAYPVRESGGIVWAYLGPIDQEPLFHEYGWAKVDKDRRLLDAIDLDCNFSKGLESLLDSSHVSLLHEDSMRKSARFRSTISSNPASGMIDPAPELHIETTDFGFHYVSLRDAAAGHMQARLSVYVAPYLCFVAPQDTAFLSVPLDDLHTRLYLIAWSPKIPVTPALRADWVRFMGLEPAVLDACGLARRPIGEGALSNRNTFIQDRAAMKSGASYSGLSGIVAEDAAMITSIPGVSDFSGEHLTASDAAIVHVRRILWRMARSDQEMGRGLPSIPAGLNSEAINSASRILSQADDWRTIAPYTRSSTMGKATDPAAPKASC